MFLANTTRYLCFRTAFRAWPDLDLVTTTAATTALPVLLSIQRGACGSRPVLARCASPAPTNTSAPPREATPDVDDDEKRCTPSNTKPKHGHLPECHAQVLGNTIIVRRRTAYGTAASRLALPSNPGLQPMRLHHPLLFSLDGRSTTAIRCVHASIPSTSPECHDNATSQYPMQRKAIHGCYEFFPGAGPWECLTGPPRLRHWFSLATARTASLAVHSSTPSRCCICVCTASNYCAPTGYLSHACAPHWITNDTSRPPHGLASHYPSLATTKLPAPPTSLRLAKHSRAGGQASTPHPLYNGIQWLLAGPSCARADDLPPPVLASPRGAGPFTATAQTRQRGRNRRRYSVPTQTFATERGLGPLFQGSHTHHQSKNRKAAVPNVSPHLHAAMPAGAAEGLRDPRRDEINILHSRTGRHLISDMIVSVSPLPTFISLTGGIVVDDRVPAHVFSDRTHLQ
ncbi:hypothetical protein CSOJ01_04163 [Colletotrichum sojae]|uniref:Uncharacterized protein n=1 Tax=Colletotrichum sojae TaxID=2175907 RepID=A0A8H6JJF7_9PEZI|nr:hypothetical protein CSOJ01_04163 [Colletotrichum sojae]